MNAQTVINTLWIGPVTRLVRECLTSMVRAGCTVRLHTYAPDDSVHIDGIELADANAVMPESEIFTYGRTAGKGNGSVAAFANLFRYRLLAEQGGWWMDADMYCLRRPAFDSEYVFAAEPGITSLLHNGAIRVPGRAPLMLEVDRQAQLAPRENIPWGATGAHLLTRVMTRHFPELRKFVVQPDVFCPLPYTKIVDILKPGRAAAHYRLPTRLPQHTVAVHLWNEMWRRNQIDPNAEHAIYGWLRLMSTAPVAGGPTL